MSASVVICTWYNGSTVTGALGRIAKTKSNAFLAVFLSVSALCIHDHGLPERVDRITCDLCV